MTTPCPNTTITTTSTVTATPTTIPMSMSTITPRIMGMVIITQLTITTVIAMPREKLATTSSMRASSPDRSPGGR